MKASKLLLAFSMIAIICMPGMALADGVFIPDTTLVDPYRWNAPSTYPGWTNWTDIIGDPTTNWDLKGVNIAFTADKVQMTIYTNYPQAGLEGAGQADIALGKNGVFDTGIKMSGPNLGKIYSVTAWTKSSDNPPLPWSNGNWIYSGKYDQSAPKDPLTLISSGTVVGSANVSWGAAGSGGSLATYAINVEFNRNLMGENFDFELGSGTCANDWMAGSVSSEVGNPAPIPASVLLMGSGLLGLGLLGRRKVPQV
jgi:hypothetical protein